MQSNSSTTALTGPRSASSTATVAPALFAALLGAFLIWGVGFYQSSFVHNAAHDMRHSNAFPCH